MSNCVPVSEDSHGRHRFRSRTLMCDVSKSQICYADSSGCDWIALSPQLYFALSSKNVTCKTLCKSGLQEDGDMAHCPFCFFAFCTICRESYHPATTCMSPEERLKLLKLRETETVNI